MSVRQLLWAADGRQRAEWGRTAALVATIHGIMGNKVDPEKFMPERYRSTAPRREPVKSKEQIEVENVVAWQLLGEWMKGGR